VAVLVAFPAVLPAGTRNDREPSRSVSGAGQGYRYDLNTLKTITGLPTANHQWGAGAGARATPGQRNAMTTVVQWLGAASLPHRCSTSGLYHHYHHYHHHLHHHFGLPCSCALHSRLSATPSCFSQSSKFLSTASLETVPVLSTRPRNFPRRTRHYSQNSGASLPKSSCGLRSEPSTGKQSPSQTIAGIAR
jgi:hypothetical protein